MTGKRKSTSARNYKAQRDINIVELGNRAEAKQVAAGDSIEQSATRARGAQPGNTNALKHGFYSDRAAEFFGDEGALMNDALVSSTLDEEIRILRSVIVRVMELVPDAEPERLLMLLNTIGAATVRVATLKRTEKFLGAGSNELFAKLMHKAVKEIADERGWKVPVE